MSKENVSQTGAVESKENSITIKYGTMGQVIDEACKVLESAMNRQDPVSMRHFKELVLYTISLRERISTIGRDEVSIQDAKLPAKLVDWLNPVRGYFVYGEFDSPNLKHMYKDVKPLSMDWNWYEGAVVAIARSVNKRNVVICDKPLIDNSVAIFTTDQGYFDEPSMDKSTKVKLANDKITKLLPVLDVGEGGLFYIGSDTMPQSVYAARLGQSLIDLFQDLGVSK